jgi:CubicO group peptidase (beta-lactamase class C family)
VQKQPAEADTSPPASGWTQYESPDDDGFASDKLAAAFRYADSVKSGAVMVVHKGTVVAAWGDVSRKLELHSVRKSLVSALFGIAASRNEISLDKTLGQLGIIDNAPLTDGEQAARVRDILAARSGVYLPAAYADASQDRERPARGSHAPNTFWFYNNWDFNTLETIYERFVDSTLYKSFNERIARPIGMQDYSPADGFLVYEPSLSMFPAHTIRMSARDLARFGQLFLQGGRWNGRQVVPRGWIAESTTSKSATGPENRGYGYLWWTLSATEPSKAYPEVDKLSMFYGSGTGGQLVLVIPSEELVIVHRGDTDHGRNVAGKDAWHIVEMILEARTGASASPGRRVPLAPTPFASQLPRADTPHFITLTPAMKAEVSGNYEIAPGSFIRVFEWKGRLFGNVPGQGEAELFALTPSEFTIRVEPGVHAVFERDGSGRVTSLSLHVGRQAIHGVKR